MQYNFNFLSKQPKALQIGLIIANYFYFKFLLLLAKHIGMGYSVFWLIWL